jgi:uncharacterized protein DUF6717
MNLLEEILMSNALMVINPYKWEGMWVFDDDKVDLIREPFVFGADKIIDKALALKGIKHPEKGFRLIFSAGPFPEFDLQFEWVRQGDGGNYYKSDEFQMEGWLCPALLKYFDDPPQEIYAKFENKGS